eukprot:m.31525 g.31525  ORF g.31525 m.31525 type:complete len:424 (+) comp12082_c0_seq1:254-1525(+)
MFVMMAGTLVLVLLFAASCNAYNNGVGLKPALGWNTWCTLSDCHNGDNAYFDRCNEWEILEIADAMVSNGMHDLGFEYINLDDCWADTARDPTTGAIRPDPNRFPSGMKAVADQIHAKGLKFGLYTSMGSSTCNQGGRPTKIPGSFGHYDLDTQTFAEWGMDYVKVDWCGSDLFDPKLQHTQLSHGLNATGRPIWLELCRGYSYDPIPEYVTEVAQSWRITGDHQDEWSNTKKVIQGFMAPSNPGRSYAWNYGDFLMTGGPGCNLNNSDHCPFSTDDEYRTSFSVWTIASSPLIVSTDIRNLTAIMKQCLLNKQAIAINQDYQSAAGRLVQQGSDPGCNSTLGNCPIFGRKLSDGTFAAVPINFGDTGVLNITVPFTALGAPEGSKFTVVDVLYQRTLGTYTDNFVATNLGPHMSMLLMFSSA